MSQNNNLEKHFTASALIIENNKVLLLFHKKLNVWLYPGGHVEKNETPEQTLFREVKEETGLDIEIIGEKDEELSDFKNDVTAIYKPYTILCELVEDHYHNDIIYLCKITGTNKKIKYISSESSDYKFFGVEDLNNIKLFPNFKHLLNKVLNNCS